MISDQDRLPAPHPKFSAHFRHAIYDTDLADNDDTLPFGTDEGFDTVWDWADRSDELQADPRVDLILDGSLATTVREALDGDLNSIVFVISAGFTVLRYTGSIDLAGRNGLRRVLVDLADTDSDAEQMLIDLDSYQPDDQTAATATRATRRQRRPRPWLVITGPPNDRPHNRWLKDIADTVMADPAWQQWWTHTTNEQLILHTSPLGPPEGIIYVQSDEPIRLVIVGSHPDVVTYLRTEFEDHDPPPRDDSDDEDDWPPIHELVPEGPSLYRQLILTMLHKATDHLDMPKPPDSLPLRGATHLSRGLTDARRGILLRTASDSKPPRLPAE